MSAPLTRLAALSLVAVLTACGGASADNEPQASGELTPVTFAGLSVAQVATVVAAHEAGIFEDHGLDLEIEFVEAATVVPSLVSGDTQFGWLSAPAAIVARSNGVPIRSVVTGSVAGEDPDAFPIQMMVPPGSDIAEPADLVGQRVAIDSLFGLPDLSLRRVLADSGVDPEDLELVEIPFPEMGAALEAGRVDAVLASEPFGTILRNSGAAEDIFSASEGQVAGSPQSVILASEQLVQSEPDLVEDFRAAVADAMEYAATHEDEVRAAVPTFTQIDEELASEIRFAPMSSEDDPTGWEEWADLVLETGAIDSPVDVSEVYLAE